MKVYKHLDEFNGVEFPVVTIGIFDGVHLGHQKIIERLIESAHLLKGESALLSFFPHPRAILQPDSKDLRLINTLDEKVSLLESIGLEHLIIHPFDKDFSEITSIEFIKNILVQKMKVKKLIIGYDHHFGKDRSGSFEQLKSASLENHFELEEIPAQDLKEINISSTKIRQALLEGNVKYANEFLGYQYFIRGTVVEGDKIGRMINFPTANIYVDEKYKLIPMNGVYVVQVKIADRLYSGMLNIGNRPTFPGKDFSIEVHILEFNQDIYGQTIQVSFVERIRDEVKFADINALETQLIKDREHVISKRL